MALCNLSTHQDKSLLCKLNTFSHATKSPDVVHSNPESDGVCQTYPAARQNMGPDPLKEPDESPRKNSIERLYSASGMLHAPSSHILRCEHCRLTGVLEKTLSLAPLESCGKLQRKCPQSLCKTKGVSTERCQATIQGDRS